MLKTKAEVALEELLYENLDASVRRGGDRVDRLTCGGEAEVAVLHRGSNSSRALISQRAALFANVRGWREPSSPDDFLLLHPPPLRPTPPQCGATAKCGRCLSAFPQAAT